MKRLFFDTLSLCLVWMNLQAFGMLCNGRVDAKNLPPDVREYSPVQSGQVSLEMLGEDGRALLW